MPWNSPKAAVLLTSPAEAGNDRVICPRADGADVTDPITMSVASALAVKAAEAAAEGGKSAWAALVRVVRARLGHDKAAAGALENACAQPHDLAVVRVLALALERIAAADAEFGERLDELWPSARAELSARESGIVNSNAGTVGGHLIQAKDLHVEGGLYLGEAHGPRPS